MDKITLVCTSLNPQRHLLEKMLVSASKFDEIILHIDEEKFPSKYGHPFLQIGRLFSDKHLEIPEAYNEMIHNANTEWICCFCDDDYFYNFPKPSGLTKMLEEVHKGIDADVAHFKFHVSGYAPPQDVRCWFGKKEYDLYEEKPITPQLLEKHNRLPAGSFFRKIAWAKVGGFQGKFEHDRNLWLRMAQAGCKFKYYPHLVYNFVRRENSAWCKQNRKEK